MCFVFLLSAKSDTSFPSLLVSNVTPETATTFNAEAHIALINQTFFANLKLDVAEFAVGQVCNSTNLNPRIATLLKISHIAAC